MENIFLDDFGHENIENQACKDGRSRTWMILLYEDDPTHRAVLDGKLNELDWNYAGRIHDSDPDVKTHYHIVCVFKDGRKNVDVANDLGIETRWLRAWDRQKKAFRYLCHKDNQGKFQYSPDGIYGTMAEKAVSVCSKGDEQSELQAVQEICDFLNSIDGEVTYNFFLSAIAQKGLFSVFRRMGIIGVRLVDEHNNFIRTRYQNNFVNDLRTTDFSTFVQTMNKLSWDEMAELGFELDKKITM